MTTSAGLLAPETATERPHPDSADGSIATADLILAMLDSGKGISDLIFSPGRPPQVERHGSLTPVAIPGLAMLKPEHTARVAHDLIAGHEKAARVLEEQGECDLSYSLPNRSRFRVNVFR